VNREGAEGADKTQTNPYEVLCCCVGLWSGTHCCACNRATDTCKSYFGFTNNWNYKWNRKTLIYTISFFAAVFKMHYKHISTDWALRSEGVDSRLSLSVRNVRVTTTLSLMFRIVRAYQSVGIELPTKETTPALRALQWQ